MEKSLNPVLVETQAQALWHDHADSLKPVVSSENAASEKAFAMVMPPPNVTGVLHMGHALDHTLQDVLTRYHRLCGTPSLWLPGTDHAGIATQNVVERQLKTQGTNRHELGREAFLQQVWQWANQSKQHIIGQCKRLATSPDWSRERFTLDEGLSHAVRVAFKRLYDDGLIEQDQAIINWCPRCESAISDIETDYTDQDSALWKIRYEAADSPENALIIATTRPETLFGDVAVAVHPNDERYQHWIGTQVRVPLTGRLIPVIADTSVEPEFGTGALKITPAHDATDFAIGRAHQLEPLWVIDPQGRLAASDLVPQALHGVERFDARKQVEVLLETAKLLVEKLDHANRVGQCQRCATPIEPYLSKQWFVRTKPLANAALESLNNGEICFIPERWDKEYRRWLENIQDWCVSRQLWWGHQIPAWHCQTCQHVTVAVETPSHCEACHSDQLAQDPDVLDTWFSSGLWPFSTLNWPDEHAADYLAFYPTHTLVTGFDIIFFWVARMTMLGLKLTGKTPFKTVFVHGLVRDEKGQKMSKSKGNTIDPVAMIEQYGCDGFRFALASMVTYGGQDITLTPSRFEQGKLFANKLWNASRFVIMNLEDMPESVHSKGLEAYNWNEFSLIDQWVLGHASTCLSQVHQQVQDYRFGEYADTIYRFTWNVFCDWYVEAAKPQLRDPAQKARTQAVLLSVLHTVLHLLHPIMPSITEVLWQAVPQKSKTDDSLASKLLASSRLPALSFSGESIESVDYLLNLVTAMRHIRQANGVAHSQSTAMTLYSDNASELAALGHAGQALLQQFVKLASLTIQAQNAVPTDKAQLALETVGHTTIAMSLAGLVDPAVLNEQRQKKLKVLLAEKAQLEGMLANAGFLAKAPAEVLQEKRERLSELENQLSTLT